MATISKPLTDLIEDAHALFRREALVHKTPVFTSHYFDCETNCKVYFKAENLQKTGSFKARGATYAVSKLKSEEPNFTGVVTHSSGNHGQALAYAAKRCGVPCTVVVPRGAPAVKIDAMRSYGAEIVLCEPTLNSREQTCQQIVNTTGKRLVHPHSDTYVMAGQGTIAIELLEDIPQLDAVFVPVGGGGMVSGIASWLKLAKPQCGVFAVEPFGKNIAADIANATNPGHVYSTIADGMRVERLGGLCFPLISLLVDEVFSVTNEEILQAMKLIWERMKLIIEPSSATGVAALLTEKFRTLEDKPKHVAVILCGGNVDLDPFFKELSQTGS